MLTPFDDFPIHASGNPVAQPQTGDLNLYDRYWFNGQDREGRFFLAVAMGHFPMRGVIDAAFSLVFENVEHSLFASGRMPRDRSTRVGPITIEVLEPMRTLRVIADPVAEGLGADLIFRAKTIALEEPRQSIVTSDGILAVDTTRLTQWGSWEGTIWVDGTEIRVDPDETVATRDRSWGVRGSTVGEPIITNRHTSGDPKIFWLWAPIHFEDTFVHVMIGERPNGTRWLDAARFIPPLEVDEAPVCGRDLTTKLQIVGYDLDWKPGTREATSATFELRDPSGAVHELVLESQYTFRMRGMGYTHPYWRHGSSHGELEVGRESIALTDFDPIDVSSLHLQNVVTARMGDRIGLGVLEQWHLGPHQPTGLSGYVNGFSAK